MSNVVDVDRIWTNLGRSGRYQKLQLIVGLIAIWSCGFHMLSIVFIGYRPSYRCREPPTSGIYMNQTWASNVSYVTTPVSYDVTNDTETIEYEKCSITRTRNVSGQISVTEKECTHGWYYHDHGEEFNKDRSFVSEWDLVCGSDELAELSQTLVMVGQGFGAFVFTSLADKYGRKKVHIASHISLFLIVLITTFVPNYMSFAAMRALTGAAQQGTGLTVAILNLELFPKEIRAYVEVAGLLFWTTGFALLTPIALVFKDMSWRYLQFCLALMSSWSLIQWWLIDESLRWLIANNKMAEAKRIIQKACRQNKKSYKEVLVDTGFYEQEMRLNDIEVKALEESTKSKSQHDTTSAEYVRLGENGEHLQSNGVQKMATKLTIKKYTFVDLVKSRRLFISSLIMWFAWITNSLTYYGIMLISSSLAGNRFLNFFLGSIVEYPAAFMEYVMINRYGRKPTAIVFHCICGIALVIATVLTTTADGNTAMILGSTVFTLIGKFSITGSFSTIFLYTPELYPTNMRNIGIGMSSATARLGGMVAPFSRNLAEVAVWAPGLVFGTMCGIVVLTMIWVPETNQYELPVTLEECEQWYKDNRLRLPCSRRRRNRIDADETEAEVT